MMFKKQIENAEVSELSAIDKQIFETESKLMHLQEQRREIINRNNLNKNDSDVVVSKFLSTSYR